MSHKRHFTLPSSVKYEIDGICGEMPDMHMHNRFHFLR